MKFKNFEYDGVLASDYDIAVCTFGGKGLETVNYGSQISFDTVKMMGGNKFVLTNASYDEALEFTFQICKNPCSNDNKNFYFTTDEQRFIYRWLNRKDGFHKLKLFIPNYETIVFNGSFNIEVLESDGEIVGFELTFQSESPYGYFDNHRIMHSFTSSNDEYVIIDQSDDIGYIYPDLKITCKSNGNLEIHNSIEDRTTIIKNCTSGEVISIDKNLNIQTSLNSHKLYNDFNFIFFRIANTFTNRKNIISVSIPCDIEIRYDPVVKGVSV